MIKSCIILLLAAAYSDHANGKSICSQKETTTSTCSHNETTTPTCSHNETTTPTCSNNETTTSTCSHKEIDISYLETVIDVILKGKYKIPTCPKLRMFSKSTFDGAQPVDCADVFQMGHNKSGVYQIWPMSRLTEGTPLNVYCDMDTDGGGWTVIQRRGDFGSSKGYFYQNWESYKEGFGDVQKDFWLGNDNIFSLTNQKLYSARFDLMDVGQNRTFAHYDKFWIDDESNKYKLHISIYRGNAGDSMKDEHNNRKFSTKDQDNDDSSKGSCAVEYTGAWWYGNCHHANLNGLYLKGKHESYANGVHWETWRGYNESLERTEIKVRPKTFITPSFASEANPS